MKHPVVHRSLYKAAICALPALLAPSAAQAVIFESTADPTYNTTAPTGSLLNSGWQYQGIWLGGFLGTPIAPHYFVSAAHLGGGAGNAFTYNGATYTTVAFPDSSTSKTFGDLRLFKVDLPFYSYAPMYTATDESGKPLVDIGRGTQRGSAIVVNAENKGWNWGPADSVERWGQNTVAGFANNVAANDLLKMNFDRTGSGDNVPNEAVLSAGDSGGGLFINSGTQWKLAGINYAVDDYRLTAGGATFSAALYDTGGLYDDANNLIADTATDKPSAFYASRVSSSYSSLLSLIDLGPTWNVDASSNWATTGNWIAGTPPSAIDAVADFRTVISAPRTVTLSSAKTVGTIDFDNTNRYTLTGSTITIDVSSGSGAINVASGSHTIASALTLNDSTTFRVIQASSVLTVSGTLTATGKTITKEGLGSLEVNNVRAAGLVVNDGKVSVLVNGTAAGTSKVTSVATANSGKIDLNDNSLIIDYTGSSTLGTWGGSSYNGTTGMLASARNGGAWNGLGIGSTSAGSSGGLMTLGIAEASQALGISGTQTATFRGQTVDATSVLVKYTYAGDANLDGKINVDDYTRIDFNISLGSKGYYNGDFNYDGKINVDDYTIIDFNVGIQGAVLTNTLADASGFAGVSAVPEPTLVAPLIVGWAGASCLRRRRR